MSIGDKSYRPFDDEQLARHIETVLEVQPPTGGILEYAFPVIKRVFRPVVVDADRIPNYPCLFIANHGLFGLDGTILLPLMLREYGRFLRGFGDRGLFAGRMRDVMVSMGHALAHPRVCGAMMEAKQDILLYPGGAREFNKRADQNYSLLWEERYGFVRLAAEHGYTIVPVASVGPDEFYGHLIEGGDLPESWLGQLFQRLGMLSEDTRRDALPPIPVGLLGTLLPKPKRCYFQFGEPVDLSAEAGRRLNKKRLLEIRQQVADEIGKMIGQLLVLREQQRGEEGLVHRLLNL